MSPEYFGHVALKFGSWAWWAVEAQPLMVQEKAIVLPRQQIREWVLTRNVKFKLSGSAKGLKSEYKSIPKPFTLAE